MADRPWSECEAIVSTATLRACCNTARYRCASEHLVCGIHARAGKSSTLRICSICGKACRGKKRRFIAGVAT